MEALKEGQCVKQKEYLGIEELLVSQYSLEIFP